MCRRPRPGLWMGACLALLPALPAPLTAAEAPSELPSIALPLDEDRDYRVGPGDQLGILVPRYTEQSGQVTVARDGTITLGLIENFKVEGLMPPDIERALTTALARYLRRPEGIRVVVLAKRMTVRVYGNVGRAGEVLVPRDANVQMVVLAAEPLPGSILTDIRLRRRNGDWVEEQGVDLQAYRTGRGSLPTLQSGDEIFVRAIDAVPDVTEFTGGPTSIVGGAGPQRGSVQVVGAVARPGEVVIRGDTNLLQVLLLAGYNPTEADLTQVRVIRGGAGRPLVVDLQAFLQNGTPPPPLVSSGDIITVPSRTQMTRTIAVRGYVARPSVVTLPDSANLQDAIAAVGGATPDGNLREVQIRRLVDGQPVTLTADVQGYIETGDESLLQPLLNGDEVHVIRGRQPIDLPGAHVEVRGTGVSKPGQYALASRRALIYALDQAGVLPTANLRRIQLVHTDGQSSAGEETVTFDLASYHAGTGQALPELRDGDIVTVEQNRVVVIGAVNMQGEVPFPARATVVEALRLAGGVRPEANVRSIVVARVGENGPEQLTVNLEAYVDSPETQGPILELRDGDRITVPLGVLEDRVANVLGAVGSPGPVEIVGRQMSIITAIQRAGNLRPDADRRRVRIIRPANGAFDVQFIDVGQIERGDWVGTIPQVLPGDLVRVDPIGESRGGVLTFGSFSRQGWNEWREGMTLQDLIADNPLSGGAALDRIRLVRGDGSGVLTFNVNSFTQDNQPWPELRPGDMVAVDGRRQGTDILDEALRIFSLSRILF